MLISGMISGTSFDAVDMAAADLAIDGDRIHMRTKGELSVPIPDELRWEIAEALPPRSTSAKAICQSGYEAGTVLRQRRRTRHR
jgi:anhydro-N-acetylmuramic acid kinase